MPDYKPKHLSKAEYHWQLWDDIQRQRKRERREAIVWLSAAVLIAMVPFIYWYIILH